VGVAGEGPVGMCRLQPHIPSSGPSAAPWRWQATWVGPPAPCWPMLRASRSWAAWRSRSWWGPSSPPAAQCSYWRSRPAGARTGDPAQRATAPWGDSAV